MTWLTTWRGVLWTGGLAAVLFIIRAFLDFRYVYPEFTSADDLVTNGVSFVIYGLASAGWMRALVAVGREERGGVIAIAIMSAVLLIVMWIATAVVFCPFPCSSVYPLGEAVNTGGLIAGLLALVASVGRLRAG